MKNELSLTPIDTAIVWQLKAATVMLTAMSLVSACKLNTTEDIIIPMSLVYTTSEPLVIYTKE